MQTGETDNARQSSDGLFNHPISGASVIAQSRIKAHAKAAGIPQA